MKPRDSLSRIAMKLLCTLLGIVLAVMLGGTLIFRHYLSQIHYTAQQEPSAGGVLSVFSAIPLGNSGENQIGGPGSDLLNILLIGQDARDGDTQSRSDAMILCSYNKKTNTLITTSFLRDLYVEIPGHGSNRINAAYSFGGTKLLKKTLEHNFGLYIDGSLEVDFSHFSEIIDHLGGVEIQLRQDEAKVINKQTGSNLCEGLQKLDGFQALTYSRIRNLDTDGDFSRTDRQRKVINALVDAFRDIRITELTPLINDLLPMLTTDLNPGQILFCALEVLPNLSVMEISSQKIPAEGTFTDKTIDGMAVLVADMPAQRQYLQNTLLG